MKRFLPILAACLLLLTLACASAPEGTAPEAPAVSVPETVDVKLTLPLGTRDDVTKALPAYTAGFSARSGDALTFSAVSADPAVAEAILSDDGTLHVIAHGTGETKLYVKAVTATGSEAESTVSVTVRDARRMLVLITLGVLSVILLALLGKPSAKKPAPAPAAAEAPGNAENDKPERS
ncbi:MAG: hypothetical protein IJL62_09125 [Clostridia bacterium]|nr:hypothetical protein [Clostridia bacterium]